jgi:hypothetical protein
MYRNVTALVVGFLAVVLACTVASAGIVYPVNYSFEDDNTWGPNPPPGEGAGWLEGDQFPSGWTCYDPNQSTFCDIDYNDGQAVIPYLPGCTGNQFLGMFDNNVTPQISQVLSNTIKAGYAYQLLVDYAAASSFGGTSTITLSANGPVTVPAVDGNGNIYLTPGPGSPVVARVINSTELTGVFDWDAWTYTGPGFTTFSTAIALPSQSLVGQPLTVSLNVAGGGGPDDQAGTNATWFIDNVRINEIMPGDANGDGQVDINDLTVVLSNYNQTGMTWSQGEFTGDGKVDINDLTIVLAHYGQTSSAAIGAVPEPGTLLMLAAGIVGLLICACRKPK